MTQPETGTTTRPEAAAADPSSPAAAPNPAAAGPRYQEGTPFTTEQHRDTGGGEPGPVLVWRFQRPVRAVASAIVGGGVREVRWAINAHVRSDYGRMDPQQHLAEIAADTGLDPAAGVGLLTAADLGKVATATDQGVRCDATVGVSYPTWASAPEDEPLPDKPWWPGTINLVCQFPVPLTDAALVGAVITATEAKTQALLAGGVDGTGTASDAIVICCPTEGRHGPTTSQDDPEAGQDDPEASITFAGPRSEWGSRLARAVHAAVTDGLAKYLQRD